MVQFMKKLSIMSNSKNEEDINSKENKFKEFDELQDSVDKSVKGFFHSTPLIIYQENSNKFEIDLKKFFLISALSGENILFSGGTGIGKTTFSKSFLSGIFGSNYSVLQLDVGLDESKYLDVDFKKMKQGKKLSESIVESQLINAPGVIFDEYNRAIGLQTSLIQSWLANYELTVAGNKKILPGLKLRDNSNFQFKIATVNEGAEYVNVQEIDLASRDRFSIELNLDNFPMNDNDKRNLITHPQFRKLLEINSDNKKLIRSENKSKTFFDLYFKIKDIQISGEAQEFMVYLQRLDNCYKSPLGTKKSFITFNELTCEGCHANNIDNGICSGIHAVSPRTASNLISLARVFASYRIYKMNQENKKTINKVTIPDLKAIAPFVLSINKLGLSKNWIERSSDITGNSEYNAIITIFNIIEKRYKQDFEDINDLILKENKKKQLTEAEISRLNNLMSKNPWSKPREDIMKLYNHIKNNGY